MGVTRARKQLVVTRALARTHWGKRKPCVPSRFIKEMTGETPLPDPARKRARRKPAPAAKKKTPKSRKAKASPKAKKKPAAKKK